MASRSCSSQWSTTPDRRRVPDDETKSLRRQVKREKKAVAREMRRDGVADMRAKEGESLAAREAKRAVARANRTWLEGEAASHNAQVRMGKGVLRGAGKW